MPRQIPAALPLDEVSWARDEKPLPQLPSPTLTNPDYILPSALPKISSPPRVTRRPPSPSYLRDKSEESAPRMGATGKKEKLGLMSRKMMLLRSRTASGGQVAGSPSSQKGRSGDSGFIPSSPILQDVGNLAPEQAPFLQLPDFDRRSVSGGSSSSDISGMAAFLAKYEKKDASSDDETMLYQDAEAEALEAPVEVANTEADSEMSEERRKQQQEEYQSAILSKRAEQILANAKKRLNVMEGNLRGAKELVAPLTAANLKRATSLGSAHYAPTYGRRYEPNEFDYEDGHQSDHIVHAQTSSPNMARDYYNHARGFSETEVPERSQTALDYPYEAYHATSRQMHTASKRIVEVSNQALRPTRSYDVLGGYGLGRERPLHARASPDSGTSGYLETLPEADEMRRATRESEVETSNHGLGIYRPSSRTSDLRAQMSSLKGKISNLKERAREESLRRQSESNLRHASPLNNAMSNAPEMYYASSSSSGYGSPVMMNTNAGAGRMSTSNSPASAHFPTTAYESRASVISGSRNAFAEQAAAQKQHGISQAQVIKVAIASSRHQVHHEDAQSRPPSAHRRTPSETAIVEAAQNRYSHPQQQLSQEMPGIFFNEAEEETYLEVPSPGVPDDDWLGSSDSSEGSSHASAHIDDDGAPSEAGESVYEDAKDDQAGIAHEDRADAFDYQNFFLHSAMGSYRSGRRGSDSSEASVSSVETAKGPAVHGDQDDYDDQFDSRTAEFPPATPETPEKLREIEANLHKRSFSEESVSTLATYATADEEMDDRMSPRVPSPATRMFSPSIPRPVSRPGSRPQSRPSTAVNRALPSDNGSDRADSGVGLPRRAIPPPGSMTPKARKNLSSSTNTITPPTSPRGAAKLDPAAIAVNALLDSAGRPLGLRNKAVLFSVVESLRKVVSQLQELDETSYEARDLRGRLDEAKYMLDGRGGQ